MSKPIFKEHAHLIKYFLARNYGIQIRVNGEILSYWSVGLKCADKAIKDLESIQEQTADVELHIYDQRATNLLRSLNGQKTAARFKFLPHRDHNNNIRRDHLSDLSTKWLYSRRLYEMYELIGDVRQQVDDIRDSEDPGDLIEKLLTTIEKTEL